MAKRMTEILTDRLLKEASRRWGREATHHLSPAIRVIAEAINAVDSYEIDPWDEPAVGLTRLPEEE